MRARQQNRQIILENLATTLANWCHNLAPTALARKFIDQEYRLFQFTRHITFVLYVATRNLGYMVP